eukprot:m.2393 g.2393  ORF g.2393 m.2393 type:complete len:71 (+) comp1450_c0_seq1:204-416(+)
MGPPTPPDCLEAELCRAVCAGFRMTPSLREVSNICVTLVPWNLWCGKDLPKPTGPVVNTAITHSCSTKGH